MGVSDPSAGVDGYFAPLYTQVFGTACLDLCLFNRDLCRGPFSRKRSPIRPIRPTYRIKRPPLLNGNNRHIALNIRCLPPPQKNSIGALKCGKYEINKVHLQVETVARMRSATLLSEFELGHVREYAPFVLILSALHLIIRTKS